MSWRVTHVDAAGRRRRLVLRGCGRPAAEALVEAMYGPARWLAVVRLPGAGAG